MMIEFVNNRFNIYEDIELVIARELSDLEDSGSVIYLYDDLSSQSVKNKLGESFNKENWIDNEEMFSNENTLPYLVDYFKNLQDSVLSDDSEPDYDIIKVLLNTNNGLYNDVKVVGEIYSVDLTVVSTVNDSTDLDAYDVVITTPVKAFEYFSRLSKVLFVVRDELDYNSLLRMLEEYPNKYFNVVVNSNNYYTRLLDLKNKSKRINKNLRIHTVYSHQDILLNYDELEILIESASDPDSTRKLGVGSYDLSFMTDSSKEFVSNGNTVNYLLNSNKLSTELSSYAVYYENPTIDQIMKAFASSYVVLTPVKPDIYLFNNDKSSIGEAFHVVEDEVAASNYIKGRDKLQRIMDKVQAVSFVDNSLNKYYIQDKYLDIFDELLRY